jgi:hypothetical protein
MNGREERSAAHQLGANVLHAGMATAGASASSSRIPQLPPPLHVLPHIHHHTYGHHGAAEPLRGNPRSLHPTPTPCTRPRQPSFCYIAAIYIPSPEPNLLPSTSCCFRAHTPSSHTGYTHPFTPPPFLPRHTPPITHALSGPACMGLTPVSPSLSAIFCLIASLRAGRPSAGPYPCMDAPPAGTNHMLTCQSYYCHITVSSATLRTWWCHFPLFLLQHLAMPSASISILRLNTAVSEVYMADISGCSAALCCWCGLT